MKHYDFNQNFSNTRKIASIRAFLSDEMRQVFADKPDPLVRAVRFDIEDCKVTMFDHHDTLAIAALVRLGMVPQNAVAAVDHDHAFVVPGGGSFSFPREGNFDPVDVVRVRGGEEHVLFLDDVPPLDFRPYDCWALKKGRPVEFNVFDPTGQTMEGQAPYKHFAHLRR